MNIKRIIKWIATPFLGIITSVKAVIPFLGFAGYAIYAAVTAAIVAGGCFAYDQMTPQLEIPDYGSGSPFIAMHDDRSPKSNKINDTKVIQSGGKPDKNNDDDYSCEYSKKPETSAHLTDRKLLNYPYLMDSLLIKEIASSNNSPFSDIGKWSADSGIQLTLVDKPFMGAYEVKFYPPQSAYDLSVLIQKMFVADAPVKGNAKTVAQHCRYDYIEPNWISTTQSSINERDPIISDPFYPNTEFEFNNLGTAQRKKGERGWGWDWLGGLNSKSSLVKTQSYGSNFVDAWIDIYDWTAIYKNTLKRVNIAVVDDMVLNKFLDPELHDVVFNKIYLQDMDVKRTENAGFCNYEVHDYCHGELVSSVLAAKTGSDGDFVSSLAIGNPGALGIGLNYGEKDIFGITAIELVATQKLLTSIYKYPKDLWSARALNSGLRSAVYGSDDWGVIKTHNGDYKPSNRVINLSIGESGPCGVESQRFINKIVTDTGDRVVIVAALSNRNEDYGDKGTVAACKHVLAVAAHDHKGKRIKNVSFDFDKDNYDRRYFNTISAPGVLIPLLGKPNQNNVMTGSSFAAPQVSAAAALLFAIHPDLTAKEVYSLIMQNATLLPSKYPSSGMTLRGLNAAAAVKDLMKNLSK